MPYDRIGSDDLLKKLSEEQRLQVINQWGHKYDFLGSPQAGINGERTLFNAGATRCCLEDFFIKLPDEYAYDISSLQVLSLQNIGSVHCRLTITCFCAGAVQALRAPAFPLGEETGHRDRVPRRGFCAVPSRHGLQD